MELDLDTLCDIHPRLAWDIANSIQTRAALALQRKGHVSGTVIEIEISQTPQEDLLKWSQVDINDLKLHDYARVTEDGAECVALAVVGIRLGWRMVRRMQREECADWLLEEPERKSLVALEVSGVDRGTLTSRLSQKCRQVRDAQDVDQKWAAVIGFVQPRAILVRADEASNG